jgi:hypothetical protein
MAIRLKRRVEPNRLMRSSVRLTVGAYVVAKEKVRSLDHPYTVWLPDVKGVHPVGIDLN